MDAEEEKLAENKSQLGCMDDLVIAPVLFEGAEELDVVGPYEMFWWMSLFQHLPPNQPIGESDFVKTFRSREGSTPSLFTVEPTTGVYRMSSGMRFVPDFSYDNAPPANMIVAPRRAWLNEHSRASTKRNHRLQKKVATAQSCQHIMSVCSGTFLLGPPGCSMEGTAL